MEQGELQIVSLLGESAAAFCAGLSRHLSDVHTLPARCVTDVDWQEAEQRLYQHAADAGLLCGLAFARREAFARGGLVLLAAPVVAEPRYQGRPVYFSHVVVRQEAPGQSLEELRGSTFAVNDWGSFSGYELVRYELLMLGVVGGLFSRAVESGSHARSIEMVRSGAADAAAIDSMIWDIEVRRNPEIARALRIVHSIGPNVAPPFVVSHRLAPNVRDMLKDILLTLHETAPGREVLKLGHYQRLAEVRATDYDELYAKAQRAQGAKLTTSSTGR